MYRYGFVQAYLDYFGTNRPSLHSFVSVPSTSRYVTRRSQPLRCTDYKSVPSTFNKHLALLGILPCIVCLLLLACCCLRRANRRFNRLVCCMGNTNRRQLNRHARVIASVHSADR